MAKMMTKAARGKSCRCCWSMHDSKPQARRAQRAREDKAWRKENLTS